MTTSRGQGSPKGRATDLRGSRPDKTVRMNVSDVYREIRRQRRKEAAGAIVVLAILAFSFGAALYLITELYEWMGR